jgi:4-hydroxyisophthalate hydroxylase
MTERHQVIIVGGGPVGVALAVELGLRGVSCILVERRTGLSNIPKGQNLTQRTLEHFYFWGIVDEIRAARIMPKASPIGEFVSYRHLLSPYWHVGEGRSVVNEYYFQKNERLPQYQMEKVLRSRMETLATVDTRYGWRAEHVAQDATGARVNIVAEDGSAQQVLEADYVVGCDGGHSIVRDQAGIPRSGTAFD